MASLVICMAGLNTRFHDVGFDIPKYLLPWGNQTIIHEIIERLGTFEEVYLVANRRDMYFMPALIETIRPLGLGENNIQYIGDTAGQAHTAYIGSFFIKNNKAPFFIHNADTLLIGREFEEINKKILDAYVDVFVANNPKYSYVKSKDGIVIEIAEKNCISPFASSGLYGFKDVETYQKMYDITQQNFVGKEIYIANVLDTMLKNNKLINLNELNTSHKTIVLGSPEEYMFELARLSLR